MLHIRDTYYLKYASLTNNCRRQNYVLKHRHGKMQLTLIKEYLNGTVASSRSNIIPTGPYI